MALMSFHVEEPPPRDTPYPEGWQVWRNSERGYDDEWHATDSWTATKQLLSEPEIRTGGMVYFGGDVFTMQYPRHLALTIRVRVHGVRGKKSDRERLAYGWGRLRPDRWYSEVEFGPVRFWVGPSGKCKSVADAVRQAEQSEELAVLVKKVVRLAYTDEQHRRVYCRITGEDSCEEHVVGYGSLFDPFVDLVPDGKYVCFYWWRAFPREGEPYWRKSVQTIDRGGWSSSGGSPADHAHWVKHFPEWLAEPKEAACSR